MEASSQNNRSLPQAPARVAVDKDPQSLYLKGLEGERKVTQFDPKLAPRFDSQIKEIGSALNAARMNLMAVERNYHQAADAGHADAQFAMGRLYEDGILLKANTPLTALSWLREAPVGPGTELPPDFIQAAHWYKRAAEQGHTQAQVQLASLCLAGLAGIPNPAEDGAKWYRKAAEHGDITAQCCLGILYIHGRGVDRDFAEGLGWLKQAADQGSWRARYEIARLLYRGEGLEKDVVQSAEYYTTAAEQGYAPAQVEIGLMYLHGVGVTQSTTEAVKWLTCAAKQGSKIASSHLREINRK